MAKSGVRTSGKDQHPDRRESLSQGQKRNRSPEGHPGPSQRPRRSNRLEARTARAAIHDEAQASSRTSLAGLGTTFDTGASFDAPVEEASAVAQSALPEIPYAGTIIVSLDPRPPLEVRTGLSIPRFTVRVTITDLEIGQSADSDLNLDVGALHAVVSLWSADGRIATPHAVPPLLTGRKDATLANVVSSELSERRAEATFSNLAITRPGHYRIRISIMETPLPGGDDDGVSIGSPRQLLSIETRPIHAHGFAPLVSR